MIRTSGPREERKFELQEFQPAGGNRTRRHLRKEDVGGKSPGGLFAARIVGRIDPVAQGWRVS